MSLKEKYIKVSQHNQTKTNLDKSKLEYNEKKRNSSKTRISTEISKHSRNKSVIS